MNLIFHASQEKECIKTCLDLSASEDTKCTSTCVEQNSSHQNVSQLVLTKPSDASADRKSIATYADQIPPMPATTKIISLLVFTKPLPCQRGHRMHLT